ncbi:hypothetical protein M407DRAFT_109510 [Tulasnella calospora MUT 4182]|uniref:DUF159-domain-containing protein n=1 Tax=Tulasnella calospora MUT 4182 TaxID=1051891 RepID=A0A0C3QD76_9AGAM|nr:hypothetical protein M407DRAFT_109510 [Tulasnella calospora MUT 4182]
MCGRFALWQQDLEEEIAAQYPFLDVRRYEPPEEEGGEENQAQFYPRYNIAPRSMSPVIRRMENDDHPGAILQLMKWGVIPHWQKHETNNLATMNARSEALIDGDTGIWASLKGKKRCIVPVNGYFEWLKKGNQRLPYYMKRKDDKPLLLAGLWDVTTLEDQKFPTYSFTIITTSSNSQLSFIHDRMPVFLEDEASVQTWLDPKTGWGKELAQMLKPYDHEVSAYQVPKEIGKVGTNDPSFVQPVAERKDGIAAMFKKQQETGAHLKSPSSSQPKSQNLSSSLKQEEEEEEEEKPLHSQSSVRLSQPKGKEKATTTGKTKTVSESERMTLGDAKAAQKRARQESQEEVVVVDDEEVEQIVNRPSSSSPKKKKLKKEADSAEASDKPHSQKKQAPASPRKKKVPPHAAPPQKAKITDFFKK